MRIQSFNQNQKERARSVAHIAHPESVVMLAATVRAAREMLRRDRIDGLKVRVSDASYIVSSKDLAQNVLATEV
jgi:hypothetical protein